MICGHTPASKGWSHNMPLCHHILTHFQWLMCSVLLWSYELKKPLIQWQCSFWMKSALSLDKGLSRHHIAFVMQAYASNLVLTSINSSLWSPSSLVCLIFIFWWEIWLKRLIASNFGGFLVKIMRAVSQNKNENSSQSFFKLSSDYISWISYNNNWFITPIVIWPL